MTKPTVLLDVDHTILDMTALKSAESSVIEANYGLGSAKVFWEVYEKVRQETQRKGSRRTRDGVPGYRTDRGVNGKKHRVSV